MRSNKRTQKSLVSLNSWSLNGRPTVNLSLQNGVIVETAFLLGRYFSGRVYVQFLADIHPIWIYLIHTAVLLFFFLKYSEVSWAVTKTLVNCCIEGIIKLPRFMGIVISHYKDPYETTRIQWNVNRVLLPLLSQGTIGCTPNSVPMVFIVFSRDSWGLLPINTHYIGFI